MRSHYHRHQLYRAATAAASRKTKKKHEKYLKKKKFSLYLTNTHIAFFCSQRCSRKNNLNFF